MNGKEIDPLTFPGYRLIVRLGAGNNGIVYRGRELETQQLVALKVYHPGILGKAGFLRGLDSAVLSARGLVSENAAVAFGLIEGRSGHSLALAMELVGGEFLARALQRNVRFSPVRALRLARCLADGLAAAKSAGLEGSVLHPGHIAIHGETAKIVALGWSIAEGLPARYEHAPEQGVFAPAIYAAPEFLAGARPDSRSDIFSLGAILYHMLTGLVPFKARDLAGLKLERSDGLRWPRGANSLIPSEVIGLVGRMLEGDPLFRPSAAAISETIGGLLAVTPPEEIEAVPLDLTVRDSLPPSGDIVPAPASEVKPKATRGRDMALGALVATLLLAVGMLLGRGFWGEASLHPGSEINSHETADAKSKTNSTHSNSGGRNLPEPERDMVFEEWQALQQAISAGTLDNATIKSRLSDISVNNRGSRWAERARTRLKAILKAEQDQRLVFFTSIEKKAAVLVGEKRFGTASALFYPVPDSLAGTELDSRCQERSTAILAQARKAFGQLSKKAERSVADGALSQAVSDYQVVADKYGFIELTSKAEQRIAAIGKMQEEIASQKTRNEDLKRRVAAVERLRLGFEKVKVSLTSFDFKTSSQVLSKLAADNDLTLKHRKLAARYVQVVAEEQALYSRAVARVAVGKKKLTVSMGGPEVLTVTAIEPKGLLAVGSRVKTRLHWKKIGTLQVYKTFKLTIDMTSGAEQLALASFAWHRGLGIETENGLKLAVELDQSMKTRVEMRTRFHRDVESVIMPRRAPKPFSRRRRSN
jgi:serine/threonine protein kinase